MKKQTPIKQAELDRLALRKTQAVNLNLDIHRKVKLFCAQNNFKIQAFVEKSIIDAIKTCNKH